MPLFQVVFVLIVLGVLLYLFNAFVTMIDPKFKQIINILVVLVAVFWLFSLFFGHGSLNSANIKVGGH